jgi:hypothetical protein
MEGAQISSSRFGQAIVTAPFVAMDTEAKRKGTFENPAGRQARSEVEPAQKSGLVGFNIHDLYELIKNLLRDRFKEPRSGVMGRDD